MIRSLLVRGMLTGILAGLIVFAFARLVGEPEVDRAIAFETAQDQSKGEAAETPIVTRPTQKGLGLLTGTIVYSIALGGIFGLVFAYAQGRYAITEPRPLAALIALLGWLSIVLIPTLKYPANPPAVGDPATIGIRTAAYFLLIALSLATLTLPFQLNRRLTPHLGTWNAAISASAIYVLLVAILYKLLPVIDEVPKDFPATLLWRFRIASWGMQAVLFATIGLIFGFLTERDQNTHRQEA
ncbi:CbtA family protein [Granulicella tundricola]|uniref:Cobalt transporter, subunit CbtA n=1 Tax=Granulicella tundricola (strain ATCC BAA-1859 / DSM 23138 / MP5ACTX9) TaxID=1198114 RepID=E8X5T1_GRATM|nr:CbtA family protein [Granulicella tundricola]ADW70815.1 hypothetical protein AciX9_4019 [Granulicella tundricola MP5ACTX9]